ncbi:MAG: GtrA family protein [Sulfuriferula sp.]
MPAGLFRNTTVRFILVGAIGAIVELIVFLELVKVQHGIVFSNIVAFHIAFALCYFLHYYYTHQIPFVGKRNVISGFLKYAGLMYVQLFLGSLLLWLLINKLMWAPYVAKIIQIGAVTPIGYVIQKLVIFRRECKN